MVHVYTSANFNWLAIFRDWAPMAVTCMMELLVWNYNYCMLIIARSLNYKYDGPDFLWM